MNSIDIPQATVEIRPGVFLHTVWHFFRPSPLPGYPPHRSADFLGTLLREGDGPWEYRSRIRFHVDDLAHGSDDPKLYHDLLLTMDERLSLAAVLAFNETIHANFPADCQIVQIRRDGADFHEILQLLSTIPGFHVKHLTPPAS
jgi:hypothetical protein